MEAVGFAASVAQIADLALGVFANLYTYYQKVRDAPRRSEELRERLDSLLDIIGEVQEALEQGPTSQPPLRDFETIKWWLEKAKKRTTPQAIRGIRRLKWPLDEEENTYIISQIDKLKGILDTRVGTQTLY